MNKSNKKSLYFWFNVPSIHQSFLIQSVSNTGLFDVYVCIESPLDQHRINLGWSSPSYGNVSIYYSPTFKDITTIIQASDKNSIHVFGGIKSYKQNKYAFRELICYRPKATKVLYSESVNNKGFLGAIRKALYTFERFKINKHLDLVFAIGNNGMDWFRSVGYPNQKLRRFAYLTEQSENLNKTRKKQNGPIKLLFLGRLIDYKGVRQVIDAAILLKNKGIDYSLEIIGNGALKAELEHKVTFNDLTSLVKFKEPVPNIDVDEILYNSDLILLPNQGNEGWGAIVNEALFVGTPVICSKFTGSSVLVNSERGIVLDSPTAQRLAFEIENIMTNGYSFNRNDISTWMENTNNRAINYFIDSILEPSKAPKDFII